MKVGTDAVLLATWCNVAHAQSILDIGTGNGTIALILAQRSVENATIHAVEIEERDAQQAEENFHASPWASKIHLHYGCIQDFTPDKKFDLIVSNPPYFNNSEPPPDERRHKARHTITLSYEELLTSISRLLTDEGKFNVVLPFVEGLQFIQLARMFQLYCSRQYGFRTREGKPVERWLLEFSRLQTTAETGEILLYKNTEEWSDEYVDLTRDFYLKL